MKKRLLLEPKDLKPSNECMHILGVFNPGVIEYKEEIIMIVRVSESMIQDDDAHFSVPVLDTENQIKPYKIPRNDDSYNFSDSRVIINHKGSFLTSLSHFRLGRSKDGIHFDFSDRDIILPESIYEEYGIEDPRITQIGHKYYITYSGISSTGINVRLMVTEDFVHYDRLGNIFHADNKDCVIFPEKINGKYYSLHRPSFSQFGQLNIWTAESNNLIEWGNHEVLAKAKVNFQTSHRVGAGAVPFLTKEGWVEIYHIADEDDHYHLVAMLLDKDNPNIILRRSFKPLVKPTEGYEKYGFMDHVIFTCGVIVKDNLVRIYYGVCDEKVAVCELSMDEIFENMEEL